jgi:uncharacterized protein YeaO (DUF488 family)
VSTLRAIERDLVSDSLVSRYRIGDEFSDGFVDDEGPSACAVRRKGDGGMIRVKRVYEKPARDDGFRVLVDRLWPRGLTKERAALSLWLKDVAPSPQLRKWFGHDPARWRGFQARYRKELAGRKDALKLLRQKARERTVTLLYGARDEEHNEARMLKKVLEGRK